ncbi:MAG TPA: glycerate kinase [Candidatus Tectomicrobia bacterium]|nr:glycerate kinase [Candidatus Tectomicrobia bacterium]
MKRREDLQHDLHAIFQAALKAVDPGEAIRTHVRREGDQLHVADRPYDLRQYDAVYAVGIGKAGAAMALAVEALLGDRLRGGHVVVKYGHGGPLKQVTVHEAGHPVPDEAGVRATRTLIDFVKDRGSRDLLVCLISGGGSALSPAPVDGITLAEKQEVTRQLLACGATIHEINAVRKHISRIKGGQLTRLAAPATLIALVLSDVVGDALDVIASGPTVPDTSTFADALEILRKYQLLDHAPKAIRRHLEAGRAGDIPETPKPGDAVFAHTQTVLIGRNLQALEAASRQATDLGYQSLILSSVIEGETREVAKVHAGIAKEVLASGHPLAPPACILSGGETTVTLRGQGKGGRSQEFALAMALDIRDIPGIAILSGGTDGTDGPTDAAGAAADWTTCTRAEELGLQPRLALENNDAYPFFARLGDLLITGPTQTNVMDVRIMLIAPLTSR